MKRFLLLVTATMMLSGCLEARIYIKLLEDGQALYDARIAVSKRVMEIAAEMKKLDPSQDLLKDFPKAPAKAALKKMKKGGVKLKMREYKKTADEAVFAYRASLKTLGAVSAMQGVVNAPSVTLIAGPDGSYTLALTSPQDSLAAAKDGDLPTGPQDVATQQAVMKLMFELLGQIKSLKVEAIIEVPGQIIGASPTKTAKITGNTVSWTLTGEHVMSGQSNDGPTSVQFKVPAGHSFPETALSSAAPSDAKTAIQVGLAPEGHNGDVKVKKGPPPGLTSQQCEDISHGGPAASTGCVTAEIECGQTIIGHTLGGTKHFDTKWYDSNFCWPATRDHDGGDERVYRFVPAKSGSTERFWVQAWLDTPCEKDIDMTMFMSQDANVCPPTALKNCEMPNPFKKGNTSRRENRTLLNTYGSDEVWYIVVEGADDKEAPFALTLVCEGID